MTVTHRDVVSPPRLGPQQEDGQAGEADGAEEAVAAAGLLKRGGHVAHLALESQTKVHTTVRNLITMIVKSSRTLA